MLQEIFLSLAGVPSPLWQRLRDKSEDNVDFQNYVTQPEQAMLAKLSYISQLHIEIKDSADKISYKHPSLACRAVGSAITTRHLAAFRKKIVEVESSILQRDAAHVGGYQIVPLSTIVADFTPWIRRLEMLRRVALVLKGSRSKKIPSVCTAATALEHLENERRTGYMDLEEIATQLLVTAQTTWMRSMSAWILYGQLPSPNQDDFMVKESSEQNAFNQCILSNELIPKFVSHQAAEDILSIGNALRQLSSRSTPSENLSPVTIAVSLLKSHLDKLKLLAYPLNASLLETTMNVINESVSQQALSSLLPKPKVLEICKVLQDYVLLNRGEFARALIENADARLTNRQKAQSLAGRPVRKLGRIDDMVFEDAELSVVLSKTWSDLIALQGQSETEDDIFESAKRHLIFTKVHNTTGEDQTELLSTLLPIPISLQVQLPSNSPLSMFLIPQDRKQYSKINAYLLSIRRTQMRLANLWKLNGHRRCHPAPLGPPMSATDFGKRACKSRRDRESARGVQMRRFWSSMNKSLFLLNEYESYLHGEIIHNSWKRFEAWLNTDRHLRDHSINDTHSGSTSASQHMADIGTTNDTSFRNSTLSSVSKDDPRTMARAHSSYLTALSSALLVDETQLVTHLKTLLQLLDHFIAVFGRLSTVWEGLDLQEDDGVMDAFSNFAQDEKDIFAEMDRSRTELESLLEQIVKCLKGIEKSQDMSNLTGDFARTGVSQRSSDDFVPWRARTLDRLIMKLGFMYQEEDNNELVDGTDHEE